MLFLSMSVKYGSYTGVTFDPQIGQTVDYVSDVDYVDGTTESSVILADNVARTTISTYVATIIPLDGDPAPVTVYATGDIRRRVTRFT